MTVKFVELDDTAVASLFKSGGRQATPPKQEYVDAVKASHESGKGQALPFNDEEGRKAIVAELRRAADSCEPKLTVMTKPIQIKGKPHLAFKVTAKRTRRAKGSTATPAPAAE